MKIFKTVCIQISKFGEHLLLYMYRQQGEVTDSKDTILYRGFTELADEGKLILD